MITDEEAPEEGGAGYEPAGIEFRWQAEPRGKTRVMVFLGDQLIDCHNFKLDDARERRRFLNLVVVNAREMFGVEASASDLEPALLAILEETEGRPDVVAVAPAEYKAVEDSADPERDGIYAITPDGPVQLANFTLHIDRDILLSDGGEARRSFEGPVILHGVASPFRIPAEDFGNGHRLIAAIYASAGAKAQVLCRPEVLVRAVSAISRPTRRDLTTDFGWTKERDAYRSPSVRVDRDGIRPTGPDDAERVDLGDEQCARHLDLAVPAGGELEALKRHVVVDLLALHDRRVTFTLLAAAALAVLLRFVEGMNRPALWLVGLTGGGKSFAAKLFQNFFGDFPIELGSAVGSWSSTVNFLERQGHFFRDATFLIDDFKPEVANHGQAVRLLQNYADGSARGRLNSDATSNVSREIRGVLVATGEATPDQSPSSMARTVVVDVPSRAKDVGRGLRCLAHRLRYPALMAGFIHHVIAEGRGVAFAGRVATLQASHLAEIVGAQNDLRIAGNVALLGAAFEEIAAYLGGLEGSGWGEQARRYVEADLAAIRDAMIRQVKDQQASEIFLSTLRSLIENERVRLQGYPNSGAGMASGQRPLIGKLARASTGSRDSFEVNTTLALEAVQESLRKQGRPALPTTPRALLEQLAADGKLLDEHGHPVGPEGQGRKTRSVSLGGSTCRAFRIAKEVLLGPLS